MVIRDGEQSFELVGPGGSREMPDLPVAVFGECGHPRLRSDGESLYFVAGGPDTPSRLVR